MASRALLAMLLSAAMTGPLAAAQNPQASPLVDSLLEAVHQEDAARVREILAAGIDVNAANDRGLRALGIAAMIGSAELVRQLLGAGADANATLAHGETPLMLAARAGCVDCLAALRDRGARIDATESRRGTTALMWAAAAGNARAVALLLSLGADPALRSAAAPLGRGPYLADTAQDRIEAFRLGVGQAGRSIAVSLDSDVRDDSFGLAADVVAAAKEEDDAAAAEAPVRSAAPARAPAPARPEKAGGLTALIFAVREGDAESVRQLLQAGADVNQRSNYGWTPLLTAVQNRHYRIAAELLQAGADPNIANDGGWTPLYIATDNRNIEGGDYPTRRPDMDHLALIGMLLARGANPNARMQSSTETRTIFTHQWLHEQGATPFLRAAQSGDLVLMKRLLAAGADPKIATEHGVTPLMVASGIGWVEGVTFEWSPQQTLETVRFLLDLGADVNARDVVDGRTALMGAAHKGRDDVVQLLVDRGAKLDTRDVGSRDSIHKLAGLTWQAIDYADGLVRVGVQSAVAHPSTAALLRRLMTQAGLPVPPEGRTLDSICVTALCQPESARAAQ